MTEWLFKRTGRLFARPSLWEGFARSIDLGSTLNSYNYDKNGNEADMKAILSDWSAVGDDLYEAASQFKEKSLQKEFDFVAD